MRAENQMNARAVGELPQHGADPFDQRLNVERMTVEMVNRTLRRPAVRLSVYAAPFSQAAERRRKRVLRIKRQKHEFIERSCLAERLDRFTCQRMPVTHGG